MRIAGVLGDLLSPISKTSEKGDNVLGRYGVKLSDLKRFVEGG